MYYMAAMFHRTMKAALYNGLVLDKGIQEDSGTGTDCGKRFFVIIKETKTTDHTMSGKIQEDNGTETDCGRRFFVIIKETKTTDHTISGKDE